MNNEKYAEGYLKALQDIQNIIGQSYNPEENENMNDLFCHLDHMMCDVCDHIDSLESGD